MRTAGIIRIIVGLVIAVLLTAILVVLLTGHNIFSRLGWDGGWVNGLIDRAVYTSGGMDEDTDEVVVSEQASVPADGISKIKIDWVAGSVNLRVGSGNDIVFSESSYRDLTERQEMRFSVSDSGVLQINFCEDLENIFDWFDLDANMPAKTLTMEVPASLIGSLSGIEIGTVSSSIELSGVYGEKTNLTSVSGGIRCTDVACSSLEIGSTSGSIVCENSASDALRINNVSGSIRAEGEYDSVKAESVSGSVRLSCANLPESIDVDNVSGSVTIALPEGSSFTAKLDSVSGSVSCDFPGTIGDDMVVVGSGGEVYHVNTVSGSLKIEKN